LCWKTFKKLEIIDKSSASVKADARLVEKAKLLSQKMGQSEGKLDKEALARLLSELLYFAFVVAEQQGVELEESFLQTIDELILSSVV
jgi:hypothetical protein